MWTEVVASPPSLGTRLNETSLEVEQRPRRRKGHALLEQNRRTKRERSTLWIAVGSVMVAVLAKTIAVMTFLDSGDS